MELPEKYTYFNSAAYCNFFVKGTNREIERLFENTGEASIKHLYTRYTCFKQNTTRWKISANSLFHHHYIAWPLLKMQEYESLQTANPIFNVKIFYKTYLSIMLNHVLNKLEY